MKRYILSVLIAILVLIANAQNDTSDYVLLKNGAIIKGVIEKVENNHSVTIRSVGGEVYTYPMVEVNRLGYGKVPKTPQEKNSNIYSDYSEYDKGFWWSVEMQGGMSCYLGESNVQMLELDVVGGYRFNEYLRVGIGLGSRYYFNNEKVRYSSIEWAFPVYMNVRGNFIPGEYRTVVPYYSFDLGGTVRDGMMFRPTIGVRFGEKRSAFLLGISYMGQSLKSFKLIEAGNVVPDRKYASFVTLKVGYEF